MDEDLEQLRRKIHQAEFVNRCMSTKVEELQQQLKSYEGIKQVFDQTQQKLAEESLQPFEAAAAEVLFKEPAPSTASPATSARVP